MTITIWIDACQQAKQIQKSKNVNDGNRMRKQGNIQILSA